MNMSSDIVEGWRLSPKEVRGQATRMGIPTDMPLPEVIVVGKDAKEEFQECPQLHMDVSGESPSGYFITIPERMVLAEGETSYKPRTKVREDIRHELAHYLERREFGGWGEELGPREEAAKEVRAELRSGPKRLPFVLARLAYNLQQDYCLDDDEAFNLMEEAARNLGVSKNIISRARRLYYEMGLG